MRILIQRVKKASVTIEGKLISLINNGLLLFIGVTEDDTQEDIQWLTKKVANIRLFDDENGVMNLSVMDIDGEILAVSQFTLMASTKKGNRPSYIKAAKPEISVPLYEQFCTEMELAVNKPINYGKVRKALARNYPSSYIFRNKARFLVRRFRLENAQIFAYLGSNRARKRE